MPTVVLDPAIVEILKNLGLVGLGVVSTLIGSYYNFRLNQGQEKKNHAINAYRRLMGLQVYSAQVMVTRFEAIIHSNYHQRIWELQNTNDTEQRDFKEAERWMRKAEDGVEQVSLMIQNLSEECAELSLYFKGNASIQRAIDKVLKTENYTVQLFTTSDLVQLTADKDASIAQLQAMTEKSYIGSINRLLKLVKPKLF